MSSPGSQTHDTIYKKYKQVNCKNFFRASVSGPEPGPDLTRQTFSQHESFDVDQSDFILKSLVLFQVLFEKSLHLSVKFDPN